MLAAEIFSVFGFALIVGLGVLSNYFLHRLEVKPLMIWKEQHHPGQFIAERAYKNLKVLNDFGPKVVGSDANEIKAFNFIFDLLSEIKNSSVSNGEITVDHQVVSGNNFVRASYLNIQNLVVRVQGETDHALMLNCHFDSVPGSPGASDDIVMCCVMIELLRILANTKEKQKHSIVFLFNGSEEEDLQAAHGFITQHRWAKDVRAYINLESTGSGGREILFRSGPKHDWLIKLYRQSVPRPFGQALAEELFETGVIPSATDFEIFRDDGEIPGLDFAYVEEGWRYHTRYDSIEYLTIESVQHTGENILALMKKMANSEELADPPEGSYAIYFDYLGLFFVSYTKSVGIALNITISIIAVVIPFVIQTKFKLMNLRFVIVETLLSFITIIIGIALSAGACVLMALIMNAADNTMSWFNTIFLSIGIYGSLALVTQILTYHLMQLLCEKFIRKKSKEGNNENIGKTKVALLNIQMNGVNLFWAVLTLTITIAGYRAAYIPMVLLMISLCTNILTYALCRVLPKTRLHSWIFLHLFGHAFVFLWLCYMMITLWELFLPITAKQYYANPDIIIGLIITLWSVLCLSYFMPLTTLVKYRAVLYSILSALFIVSLILSFTSIGFPYSDNKVTPRLQRFRVINTRRVFYNSNDDETFRENGFLLSTVDRNALRTLESSFDPEKLRDWREDSECITNTYCGFPMYRFNRGRYLKGVEEPTVKATRFTKLQSARNPNNSSQVLVDFSFEPTTLTMIYLTPGDGWKYVNGSLPTLEQRWNDKSFRIAKITYGKKTNEVLRHFIALEDSPGADKNTAVVITVVTVESVFRKNSEYVETMKKFPEWTFAMEQQADVSSYSIKEN